jgi:hypothetical protein
MRSDVIVVDGFYADPAAVREYALKQDYYYPYETRESVDAGERAFTWMASRFKPAAECPFKSSLELIGALQGIVGEEIDLDHWNADFPTDSHGRAAPDHQRYANRGCLWNASFHCKPDNGQHLGDGVHNHVTDTWNGVGEDGWAGIIYLNDDAPLEGGLKLWRNRDPVRRFDWMTPAENWQLIDDIGNVANRLILARGDLPHSGSGGWGDSLQTGRLYQTFFFRTSRARKRDAVWVAM